MFLFLHSHQKQKNDVTPWFSTIQQKYTVTTGVILSFSDENFF